MYRPLPHVRRFPSRLKFPASFVEFLIIGSMWLCLHRQTSPENVVGERWREEVRRASWAQHVVRRVLPFRASELNRTLHQCQAGLPQSIGAHENLMRVSLLKTARRGNNLRNLHTPASEALTSTTGDIVRNLGRNDREEGPKHKSLR